MRSSVILKNLNNEEQEPLLENFDGQGSDPEVIVERDPLLHEQMEDFLREIELAKKQAPAKHKKEINKFRLYSILFFGVSIAAVTAPAVFMRYLMDGIYHLSSDLIREAQRQIDELEARIGPAEQQVAEIQPELMPYQIKFMGFMKPYFLNWWSAPGCPGASSTMTVDSFLERYNGWTSTYLCQRKEWLETHEYNSQHCVELARVGCEASFTHPNITIPLRALDESYRKASGNLDDIRWAIDRLNDDIKLGFPDRAFGFWNGGWSLIPALGVSMGALAYAIYQYVHACRDQKNLMIKLNRLHRAMPDLLYSDEFRKLAKHAGLDLKCDASILDFSKQFRQVTKDARLRDARRQMFFRGKLPRNKGTALYGFFHSYAGRTKDIQALVLQHADLLPAMPKK